MRKAYRSKDRPRKKKPVKRKRRFFTPTFFILCLLLFVVTVGISYIYFKPIFGVRPPKAISGLKRQDKHADKGAEAGQMGRLYSAGIWYDSGLERANTIVIIEDVIRRYIKPYGVSLIDLYMDRQGIVYIDLSDDIVKNFHGDAKEEYDLIMGLYRSIKNSAREIKAIKLLIEGKEAESIGGHIDISRPIRGRYASRES